MAARGTLDRGWHELAESRGPFARSAIYRLGLALQAVGAADGDDDAQEVLYAASQALPVHAPMRAVLKHAGIDVAAVEAHLRAIEHDQWERQQADDFEKLRRATHEENVRRRQWREVEKLL